MKGRSLHLLCYWHRIIITAFAKALLLASFLLPSQNPPKGSESKEVLFKKRNLPSTFQGRRDPGFTGPPGTDYHKDEWVRGGWREESDWWNSLQVHHTKFGIIKATLSKCVYGTGKKSWNPRKGECGCKKFITF